MGNASSISFYALVETYSADLLAATLLPPLSMKVTANSWSIAKRKLQRDLTKSIRKVPPEEWVRQRPLQPPEHRQVPFIIKAPKGSTAWSLAIECNVDLFSWPLSERHRHWHCPALNSVFVSDSAENSDAFLCTQIENMRTRKSEDWPLALVMSTFLNRTFRIREVASWTPTELADAYAMRDKKSNKIRTDTLRSVASLMRAWKKDSIFEVEKQVAELDDILLSTKPQSVLLVGPSGVGKTAIALQWALSHPNQKVWATSGARLVSGMSGFGMWQKRCQQVIQEAHESNSILHLGSLIELIESGKINGQPGVASMLRGAIERTRMITIAECTAEQLAVIEREDPILLRSFCKIEIDTPSEEKLERILSQVGKNLVTEVQFSVTAIAELIRLHQRFSTYSGMPGQPLAMMRSMAESWSQKRPIGASDVVERFSRDTGLPLFMLDDSIALDIDGVRADLASQVIGQPEPIERLVELITMLKARLSRRDRPLASLLLIGPTGVGKTETAKALARLLYRDASRMIRIDMSEYAQPWSATRMIGVGCDGDGTLTSPIRDQPFSVVLLDEFEKCHPSVLDLLLQVLGEGRLTDSAGRLADYRNAVIILTSNLGVESYQGRSFGFGNSSSEVHDHFTREVRRYVRPELLGRLDKIIPYGALPIDTLRGIASREIEKVAMRPGVRHRPESLVVSEATREQVVAAGVNPAYGARPLRREIERQIVIPLSEAIAKEKTLKWSESEPDTPSHASDFDFVRDLRFRAELLLRSPAYQTIENNLERLRRLMEQTEHKLARMRRERSKVHGRMQLERLRAEFGEIQKAKQSIDNTVASIEALQRDVVEQWLQDNHPPTAEQSLLASELTTKLKEELIALQSQSRPKRSISTLILLCNPIETLSPMWTAYRRLAELNGWIPSLFRLCPYDPMWDPLAREFQERNAAARGGIKIPKEREPAFHLLAASETESERKKLLDVFRIHSWDELANVSKPTMGIAMQFDNATAGTWLSEEEGVHHFVLQNDRGSDRVRARVLLLPGRLFVWNPPPGILETPSLPYRDPRRTYHASRKELHSHIMDLEVSIEDDRPDQGWFEMILSEADARIWSSVGYASIPRNAKAISPLRPFLEMPF